MWCSLMMSRKKSVIWFSLQTIMIIFHIIFNTSCALDDPQVVSFNTLVASPVYPEGGAFGKGRIDLGGLEVLKAESFKKIWDPQSDGEKGTGATFYEPTAFPNCYCLLGHYSRRNDNLGPASVLVAKDTTGDHIYGALKSPIDYILIWTSNGLNFGQYEDGYMWYPIPPIGYRSVGLIVTTTPEKPSLDKIVCVRSDFTDSVEMDTWIWGVKMRESSRNVNVYATKPLTSRLSVPLGTFLARAGGTGTETYELACLKMVRKDLYLAMPNSLQISTMINTYSPCIYFHPDEEYFPSTVLWFFQNGVELHENRKIPQAVINDGENLPKTDTYAFLDLPSDQTKKDKVKKGFLDDAIAYIHVKPALGGTHTDLVIWLYYPFNGGGKLQVGPFTINLGKLGEHVGDWEHITLRIDNFNGMLKLIYLSQHSAGKWLKPQEFEFFSGTRPVVYVSLHGHAHYNAPKYNLHGKSSIDPTDLQAFYDQLLKMNSEAHIIKKGLFLGFGLRDDTAKSNHVMDVAASYNVVSVDHEQFDMEPWLHYTGRWGPKVTYEFTEEVMVVVGELPEGIRNSVVKLLNKLPHELFGEEGPTGPNTKDSWTGEEKV